MSDEPNTTSVETEDAAAAAAVDTPPGGEQPGGDNSVTDGDGNPAVDIGSEGGDKGGEGSDADDANADAGEGSDTPPENYADFNLPEGMTIDKSALDSAAPILQKYKVSQEDAQALVDVMAGKVQAVQQGQVDAFNQLMTDWKEASKNDSEFGGDKFDESIALAKSAVDKFGTPELTKLLEDHGMGNHPEVIRFMVKVGKLTAEDVPGGDQTPTSKEKDRLEQLYPNDRTAK